MKRARLLYAEDDETLSFITKDHLELQGYEVVHCVNGALAYEAFKNEKFDLCIFDVMLPEMDGFTLAENVRKKDQQIPILFLTAKSLKEVEWKVRIYTYLPLEYQLVNDTNVRILTQRESELLDFLLKNKNRVIKRSVILESLWGEDDYFMGRSLDVFISRLRKYLGDDPAIKIDNIHGIGFKFMCP